MGKEVKEVKRDVVEDKARYGGGDWRRALGKERDKDLMEGLVGVDQVVGGEHDLRKVKFVSKVTTEGSGSWFPNSVEVPSPVQEGPAIATDPPGTGSTVFTAKRGGKRGVVFKPYTRRDWEREKDGKGDMS